MSTMLSRAVGSIEGGTWATWNTLRKASICFEEVWMRSHMDMSAFTFFSWAVMSVEGWTFLVVVKVVSVMGLEG